MNFEFENIPETGSVKYLAEHQQVLKLLLRPYDEKPTYRWIDDANSIVFYQIHKGGGPGSKHGDYALFKNGKFIRFSASRNSCEHQNLNYGISIVRLPEQLNTERKQIVNLIKASLETYSHWEALNWMPVESVNVVFAQNCWVIVPEKYSKRYFKAIFQPLEKKRNMVFYRVKRAILSPLFVTVILMLSIYISNQSYLNGNIFILITIISGGWLIKLIKKYDFNFYFSHWLIGKEKHKNSLINSLLPLNAIGLALKSVENKTFYNGLEINVKTVNTQLPEYELHFKNTGKYKLSFICLSERETLELIAPGVFALSAEEKNQLFDYYNIAEIIPKINIKSIPCKKTIIVRRRGVKNFPPIAKNMTVSFIIKDGNKPELGLYIISAHTME